MLWINKPESFPGEVWQIFGWKLEFPFPCNSFNQLWNGWGVMITRSAPLKTRQTGRAACAFHCIQPEVASALLQDFIFYIVQPQAPLHFQDVFYTLHPMSYVITLAQTTSDSYRWPNKRKKNGLHVFLDNKGHSESSQNILHLSLYSFLA